MYKYLEGFKNAIKYKFSLKAVISLLGGIKLGTLGRMNNFNCFYINL